jgi:hypothetical protein
LPVGKNSFLLAFHGSTSITEEKQARHPDEPDGSKTRLTVYSEKTSIVSGTRWTFCPEDQPTLASQEE